MAEPKPTSMNEACVISTPPVSASTVTTMQAAAAVTPGSPMEITTGSTMQGSVPVSSTPLIHLNAPSPVSSVGLTSSNITTGVPNQGNMVRFGDLSCTATSVNTAPVSRLTMNPPPYVTMASLNQRFATPINQSALSAASSTQRMPPAGYTAFSHTAISQNQPEFAANSDQAILSSGSAAGNQPNFSTNAGQLPLSSGTAMLNQPSFAASTGQLALSTGSAVGSQATFAATASGYVSTTTPSERVVMTQPYFTSNTSTVGLAGVSPGPAVLSHVGLAPVSQISLSPGFAPVNQRNLNVGNIPAPNQCSLNTCTSQASPNLNQTLPNQNTFGIVPIASNQVLLTPKPQTISQMPNTSPLPATARADHPGSYGVSNNEIRLAGITSSEQVIPGIPQPMVGQPPVADLGGVLLRSAQVANTKVSFSTPPPYIQTANMGSSASMLSNVVTATTHPVFSTNPSSTRTFEPALKNLVARPVHNIPPVHSFSEGSNVSLPQSTLQEHAIQRITSDVQAVTSDAPLDLVMKKPAQEEAVAGVLTDDSYSGPPATGQMEQTSCSTGLDLRNESSSRNDTQCTMSVVASHPPSSERPLVDDTVQKEPEPCIGPELSETRSDPVEQRDDLGMGPMHDGEPNHGSDPGTDAALECDLEQSRVCSQTCAIELDADTRDSLTSSATGESVPTVEGDSKEDSQADIPTPLLDSKESSLMEEPEAEASPAGATGGDSNEGTVPVEFADEEFEWQDYLEETGATAALPTSFKHVECSLQSGFAKGMKVEVPNKSPADSYWVATIVMPCGQLLRLRRLGCGDVSSREFWCDACSGDMKPLGWSKQNGKQLCPPDELKDQMENWQEMLREDLEGATTPPVYVLDGKTGTTAVDRIKEGMRLQVQHDLDPTSVWLVRIMENIGGRLLLRYEGTDKACHDFWLFYLNYRLHPIGWDQENDVIYKPPDVIRGEQVNEEVWQSVLFSALKEAGDLPAPADIFKDQKVPLEHEFQKGWKVEALHPHQARHLCPSTVVEVPNKHFFILEVDDLRPEDQRESVRWCCHSHTAGIYPVRWCQGQGLRLLPPKGWQKGEFDWNEYLNQTKSEAAPERCFNLDTPNHDFTPGVKLEAVNPMQPGQICAATITRIVHNLLWVHLDSSPKIGANHIMDVRSYNIFPVGWCGSNNYPLKPPRNIFQKKRVAVVQPESRHMTAEEYRSATYTQIKQSSYAGTGWCPKIYFNHRCFSGPYLSKGRIAELPKCVGPGPVTLVIKEVLTMLINVAYKSSRVLREIQLTGKPNQNLHQQVLKAKYKGKSYKAVVDICKTSEQVEEFCRQTCIKLECCPNLFSPHFVNGNCPENCHQLTKTKYSYCYGKKKRKIGRPPGGHSNLEWPKKGRRKKKRRRLVLSLVRKQSSVESDGTPNGDLKNEEVFEVVRNSSVALKHQLGYGKDELHPHKKRRKYRHFVPPPSGIQTRGARYMFEKRTHQKILLERTPARSKRLAGAPISTFQASGIDSEDALRLDSNPLFWTIQQAVDFIKTTDCANLAVRFLEEEIDGQAMLLMTLPTVQEHLELKLGPAVKLCHHIERVKIAFYEQFAN